MLMPARFLKSSAARCEIPPCPGVYADADMLERKQMFADVPTKTRISLRMEQKATVEYACDGATFSMSVRDSFGTLRGETVLKYLDKCLHAEQQMDRKGGGAGLGLYIISNAATQFLVSIHPQIATECTCTFDLKVPEKRRGLHLPLRANGIALTAHFPSPKRSTS